MSAHAVAIAVGYLGATLGVVMVVPQIARIVRHPALPGVSPFSWMLSTCACLAWLTFGLRTGATPQIPGNVLLVCGAVVCVLLINHPTSRGRRGVMLAGSVAALLVTVWTIPASAVGYVGATIGLCSTWPQLYESVANWRGHVTSGVSLPTWGLRIASQICWLFYAVGTREMSVGVGSAIALVIATATLALEASARSSRSFATSPARPAAELA